MFKKFLITSLSLTLYISIAFNNAMALDSLPEIKASAVVEDTVITLGDIFSNLDQNQDLVIGDAPAPGKKTIISARDVLNVTRSNNIRWKNSAGVKNVIVSRLSTDVAFSELKQRLAAKLKNLYHTDQNIDVRLYNNNGKIQLPVGYEMADLTIQKISLDKKSDKFSALISAPIGSDIETQHIINGRILRVTMVPSLSHTIRSGETIKASDIKWISLADNMVSRDTITHKDKLIGMTPRNQLKAEAPVRLSDIRRPILVKRGSLVQINFSTAKINLTTIGKAVEDGGQGDVIQVVNNSSKITISATVLGLNQVEVSTPNNNLVLMN